MNNSILDLIGNTPIYNIKNTNIYAKLECFNPTGSIKDRAAKEMILEAIKSGELKKGGKIIEATSGNTGIGLAAIGKSLGYEVIIVMPDSMSKERRDLLRYFGATLVLTDGKEGMALSIKKAQELKEQYPNSYITNQFDNENNMLAHYKTTGKEIYEQMNNDIDYLICGIGTGGTITGCGRYLKEKNPNVKIIGIEPDSSPIISKGYKGSHKIEGIGAGFIPKILDLSIIDKIETVSFEDSIKYAKKFINDEGILVGISSGAALAIASKYASLYPDKRIAVVLPDSGNRYFSTKLFN